MLSSTARRISSTALSTSNGLARYSNAPPWNAATALSRSENAVMMMTGRPGSFSRTVCSNSRPEPPGMRISDTSTCGLSCSSAVNASRTPEKLRVAKFSRARAFSSTQRMDWSSSTIQIGFIWFGECLRVVRCKPVETVRREYVLHGDRRPASSASAFERQHDLEFSAARPAFHFDQAIMLLDKCLGERQAKSTAIFPARYERIKDPVPDVLGNAGAVVTDMQDQCQFMQALADRDLASDARTQLDLRVALRDPFTQRFRRVANDIEQGLDKLLLVATQVGHAHVIVALDRETARKLREDHLPHAFAYFMNVHVAHDMRMPMRLQQSVDERLQPIRFLDDHLR